MLPKATLATVVEDLDEIASANGIPDYGFEFLLTSIKVVLAKVVPSQKPSPLTWSHRGPKGKWIKQSRTSSLEKAKEKFRVQAYRLKKQKKKLESQNLTQTPNIFRPTTLFEGKKKYSIRTLTLKVLKTFL